MISTIIRNVFGLASGRHAEAEYRVLFVCMGNICRSPTAEAVFRHQIDDAGLAPAVQCASAGTHDFHIGWSPDGRARAVALKRGYDMSRLRGRHVSDSDFERYDLILAMDRDNMSFLKQRCPPHCQDKLRLLMEFGRRHDASEVPDPYFGNVRAFEMVLDMIEDACGALLDHVRSNRSSKQGS